MGLTTNNQKINYLALNLSWRQKNSKSFFSYFQATCPILSISTKSDSLTLRKSALTGTSLWSLHVPTDQHSTMQNVGRSILWNKIKNSHVCKFASWRLTGHSHVRFIAPVQEQSADRLHYHSSVEKPWLLHMGGFCSFMEPHRDEQWVIWCKPSGVMFFITWVHQPTAKTRRRMPSPVPSNLDASLSSALWGSLELEGL